MIRNFALSLQRKLKKQKGFTLAELLIVVAIIAILIAIALPIFNSQMTRARSAVVDANVRAAKSMAITEWLLEPSQPTAETKYTYGTDEQGNLSRDGSKDQIVITINKDGKIISVSGDGAPDSGTGGDNSEPENTPDDTDDPDA